MKVRLVIAFLLFARAAFAQHTLPHDVIPDFSASPTIVSVANGNWGTAATWSPVRVPTSTDVVGISHTVTYNIGPGSGGGGLCDTGGFVLVIGINSGGTLQFLTNADTCLAVGTLMVNPGGTLTMGTVGTPVEDGVEAKIIIRDVDLDLMTDPGQYATGLICIDGTATMHGYDRSPTFSRMTASVDASDTTLVVTDDVSAWKAGDRIFVPDSRQVPIDDRFNDTWALHVEDLEVDSIGGTGNKTITLADALTWDHVSALDADGTPTVLGGVTLYPHVGNLTRNVIITSEDPAGTRGHALFTNRCTVDIRYALFKDLGRTQAIGLNSVTNHIGRYPLHIHHLWGPVNKANTGYQFKLIGNAITESLKWPVAIHGSHYGLIQDNVIYGGGGLTVLQGAGIAVEDGTETENLIDHNFVANIKGAINPRLSGPGAEDGQTPGSGAECIWGAGFNNRYTNNVVSTCRNAVQQIVSGPGFKFITNPSTADQQFPDFRGADMTDTDETHTDNAQQQPLLEFDNNEVYGVAADGFTVWQLNTNGGSYPSVSESLVDHFTVWNTYEAGIWNYPVNKLTVDHFTYRTNPTANSPYWLPVGVTSGDYRDINLTVRNSTIHAGLGIGEITDPIGTYTMTDNTIVGYDCGICFRTPATPGTGATRVGTGGVTWNLTNNVVSAWPGQTLASLYFTHDLSRGNSQPDEDYFVNVFDHQGTPDLNFQAYYTIQGTDDTYYGGQAPCNDTTTHTDVVGVTCATESGPPSALTGLHIVAP